MIKIDFSPANIFESDDRNIKTFHLHDFVKFCLCISLHVCVLVWLCHVESLTGLYVCFCMLVRSQSRVFCLVLALSSRGKKWNISPRPVHQSGQIKLPKANPSCLPSLPLSGVSHHSAEVAFCAKAYSSDRLCLEDRSFCVSFTFLGWCYKLWLLWFVDLKELPRLAPPAFLSQCFRSVESRAASDSDIMLCFTDSWAATCFWLCYSIHRPSSWRKSTHSLAMFVSLWRTRDLPTLYERSRCVTEVYFWCFSSSEQYFLCLIKYVFWLALIAFMCFYINWQRGGVIGLWKVGA